MADSNVKNELICPICLDFYKCPIILPCSHVLCREPCAERLFSSIRIKCPVCRDMCLVTGGVSSLPRVIALERIIETYQQTEDGKTDDNDTQKNDSDAILCQLCPTQSRKCAVRSCVDCNASYCKDCLRTTHPNRSPFTVHQLVDPCNAMVCSQHGDKTIKFCMTCKSLLCSSCLLDTGLDGSHSGHDTKDLQDASKEMKGALECSICQMECSQEILAKAIKTHDALHRDLLEQMSNRTHEINSQCDALRTEVEAKRHFFLSDLAFEGGGKLDKIQAVIKDCKKKANDAQNLAQYARDVVQETDPSAFLQLGTVVSNRINRSCIQRPMPNVQTEDVHLSALQAKKVDVRKYATILRDIHYLVAPGLPVIDVSKCYRSTSFVIIAICKPANHFDVIDGYKVYCRSDEDASMDDSNGITDVIDLKYDDDEAVSQSTTSSSAGSGVAMLVMDFFQPGQKYYFCVKAYNSIGESVDSEVVNCTTMAGPDKTTLPVPIIDVDMCRVYTTSIQIHCESPDTLNTKGIKHYLLYRQTSEDNRVWKNISLYRRKDHRVFGLDKNKEYMFMVLVCRENGEGQLSRVVTLGMQGMPEGSSSSDICTFT